jgi:hypothetical protein
MVFGKQAVPLFNSELRECIRVPVFFASGWFAGDRPARIINFQLCSSFAMPGLPEPPLF